MSTLLPFLTLDQTCDQTLAWVNKQLPIAGFRVVETFDLQAARLAHNDCNCPHHGTDRCNCQMIVLLIYPKKQENPTTLVLHGQDDKTWLSLVAAEGLRPHQALEARLRRVFLAFPVHKRGSVELIDEVH